MRAAACVLAAGLAYLLLGIFQPLNLFDEGFPLVGAERVLHGAVPYRDFAAYYAPGQLYTLAAVFHIVGPSILTERIWDALVAFGVAVMAFLLARGLGVGNLAYLSFLMVLFPIDSSGPFASWIPAMFWALVAAFVMTRTRSVSKGQFLLGGLAAGVSAFYRQDIGVYILLSGTGAVLVGKLAEVREMLPERDDRSSAGKLALCYILGFCLLPGIAGTYFLSRRALGQLWTDLLLLPRVQVQFRRLPLPPLLPWRVGGLFFSGFGRWVLFYAPLAILLVASMRILLEIAHGGYPPKPNGSQRVGFAEAVLALFGLLLFVTALTRADSNHLLLPAIPASILLAKLLERWQPRRRWALSSLAILLAAMAVPFAAVPVMRWGLALRMFPPWGPSTHFHRARFFHVPQDQEAAIRFIQGNVQPSQPIFVGNTQYRTVSGNDAMFYFLAGRKPGTMYEEFEPGVITAEPVQKEVIRELRENHVRWAVICSAFEEAPRGKPPAREGSDVLGAFLRASYHRVASFGRYTIIETNNMGANTGAAGDVRPGRTCSKTD